MKPSRCWKNERWCPMNKKRIPLNGTFELTGRCNLSCPMCLVRVDKKRIEELKLRELTAQEWIHLAEQARDAGTISLLLTGGEAMLRPDFCEIYEAIAQMGFLLTLYTNATLVTDKVMEVLRKYPPHKIGVTMYGASNETYEKMCGCADGYDRFIKGMDYLESLPSVLEVRSTIIKDNKHDLESMRAYIKKRYGKKIIISRFVMDAIRGGMASPKECRLTPEENIEMIYGYISKLYGRKSAEEVPKLKMKHYPLADDGKYLFEKCNAGIDQYTITWNGRMYACGLLNKGYTDTIAEGLLDAWEKLPIQYPLSQKVEKCESCKYAILCEQCSAVRLVESGEWFGISEYACREAKYLYELLDRIKAIED